MHWSVPEQATLGAGYFYRVRNTDNLELYTNSVTHTLLDADCRNKTCSGVPLYNPDVGECDCSVFRSGLNCEQGVSQLQQGYVMTRRQLPASANFTVIPGTNLTHCAWACGRASLCTAFAMARGWTSNADECRLYSSATPDTQGKVQLD